MSLKHFRDRFLDPALADNHSPHVRMFYHEQRYALCGTAIPDQDKLTEDHAAVSCRECLSRIDLLKRYGVPVTDPHCMTAAEMLAISPACVTEERRRLGKYANFGKVYGLMPASAPLQIVQAGCALGALPEIGPAPWRSCCGKRHYGPPCDTAELCYTCLRRRPQDQMNDGCCDSCAATETKPTTSNAE